MRDLISNYRKVKKEVETSLEKLRAEHRALQTERADIDLTSQQLARIVAPDELQQRMIAEAQERLQALEEEIADKVETKRIVAEMLSDLNYGIEWMRSGKQPNTLSRVIDHKSAYDRRMLLNMDLFPCLDVVCNADKVLSDDKKRLVTYVLSHLTERQLTCFLLHTAHMLSIRDVAKELDIEPATVHEHIRLAKSKIETIAKNIDVNSFK